MTDRAKITRRRQTPRPPVVNDAVTRGQMLKHLLDNSNTTVVDFSEATGIPRNTLQRWINGVTDLAGMERGNAHKFLVGLGISDEDAWGVFAIPEALRGEFRSDRALPTPVQGELLTIPSPLYGEMTMPAGSVLRYAPDGQGEYQLVRLSDGTYYAVRSATGEGAAHRV